MTDHPLTETAAVEMSMKFAPSVMFQMVASVAPDDLTEYARAAFDAGREYERTNPDDARPWEPLGESDQVCVGDEVSGTIAGGEKGCGGSGKPSWKLFSAQVIQLGPNATAELVQGYR